MATRIEQALPDVHDIRERYPILPAHRIEERRADIQNILSGSDPRLMMIVGPCSAWPTEAVLDYADRLSRLQEDVREKLLLVMRAYIQKPRTTVGWPGPLNQPDPQQPVDITKGVYQCSEMMWKVGQQLPLADEMLFTHNADYFEPYLSYIALGARSAEDMEHRYIASGLDLPVGVKNTTSGSIEIGVNGVQAVQASHTFAYHKHQVTTSGNPFAHLILRGGGGRPNYDPQSIAHADKLLHAKNIANPAIVIDTSHDNSHNGHGKDPELQAHVIHSVLHGITRQREEYRSVRGLMMESFLKQGKQSETGPGYDYEGLSITDPCLGWERTDDVIRKIADELDASGLTHMHTTV